MKILVTGSSGHLGEALVRTLKEQGHSVLGLDLRKSEHTDVVGSIAARDVVRASMRGIECVLHTATLHKPHVDTHSRQAFVETNIAGTLTLLEESVAAGVDSFVYTSTTSVFGDALVPPSGSPAAWITELVTPVPKNIYGVTKAAAEDLCQLFHRNHSLPVVVLRTSRFFPEPDDNAERRNAFDDLNLKVIELLYRRVDIHDVVTAHIAAMIQAPRIGFGKFIVSATSPFDQSDLVLLRGNASSVLRSKVPSFEAAFRDRRWRMLEDIHRVYVNENARTALGWIPKFGFARAIADLSGNRDVGSALARAVGYKGYHPGSAS